MTRRFASLLMCAPALFAAQRAVPLDSLERLEVKDGKAEVLEYRGRKALKIIGTAEGNANAVALIKDSKFRDGTIEVEVAGQPAAGAGGGARGFIGLAFRAHPGMAKYEYFYLRPTNGRAEDQVRRNHSAQYASHPDYPWQRLRKEEPEKYESYVDLEPGVWTKMRIVVSGTTARLFVHGAAQPSLIVNDLKMGAGEGGIALWIGPGTEGHFSNLVITD